MVDRFVNDVQVWTDGSGRQLSQRIWGNRIGLRQSLDHMITTAMAAGHTADQVASELVRYVSPDYARSKEGKARHAANRLANHEMRRAHAIGARDVALTNPAGGFLRFTTSASHAVQDECTGYAEHNEGYGRGVYPARDCPLPPRHIGCRCEVLELGVDSRDMDAAVDALRVEFDLEDPPDLSPAALAIFRRETAQVRQDVQVMFASWFQQTGVVSQQQLVSEVPTVRNWVADVQAAKRRRR